MTTTLVTLSLLGVALVILAVSGVAGMQVVRGRTAQSSSSIRLMRIVGFALLAAAVFSAAVRQFA